MISFIWHGLRFSAPEIGGGVLHGEIASHTHSKNSYELHYITAGRGELETDTAVYSLRAGDFFVTGPQLLHAQRSDPHAPMEDVFIYLQKEAVLKKDAVGDTFCETNFWFCRDFPPVIPCMILAEYREKALDFETAVSGLLSKLLTDIVRRYVPKPYIHTETLSENLNDRRFWLIENAFLDEKNLTLRALSEKIGLCERQTERLLQKYYGKSFREMKREK